jgi:protein-tyrosine phosphatase
MTASPPAPLRLEGTPNFRDLGGLTIGTEHLVRPGMVFRSGVLCDLTVRDFEWLCSLAPRCILDLRSKHERMLHPTRWPEGRPPQVFTFDIDTDVRAGPGHLKRLLLAQPGAAGARAMMRSLYQALPQACAPVLQHIFDVLTASEKTAPLPIIVHCTAGKDRTGFVVAMLLYALGATPDVVLRDYLRSADCCDLERLAPQVSAILGRMLGKLPDRETIDTINGVHADYLGAALEVIQAGWGDVRTYLVRACALDKTRQATLRRVLLADRQGSPH